MQVGRPRARSAGWSEYAANLAGGIAAYAGAKIARAGDKAFTKYVDRTFSSAGRSRSRRASRSRSRSVVRRKRSRSYSAPRRNVRRRYKSRTRSRSRSVSKKISFSSDGGRFPSCLKQSYQYSGTIHLGSNNQQKYITNGATDPLISTSGRSDMTAMLTKLRFFDNTLPATLKIVDMSSTATMSSFKFWMQSVAHFRNNGNVALKCVWYSFRCVQETNNTPYTWLVSDIANVNRVCTSAGVAVAITDPMVAPASGYSKQLNEHWKQLSFGERVVEPGEQFMITIYSPQFKYTFDEYVNETTEYSPRYNSTYLMMSVQGLIVHDNTTKTTVGTGQGVLDYVVRENRMIRYDGGFPGLVTILDSTGLGTIIVDKQEALQSPAAYTYALA